MRRASGSRYLWHLVFGEDFTMPRREEDTRLPLAIRMANIHHAEPPDLNNPL